MITHHELRGLGLPKVLEMLEKGKVGHNAVDWTTHFQKIRGTRLEDEVVDRLGSAHDNMFHSQTLTSEALNWTWSMSDPTKTVVICGPSGKVARRSTPSRYVAV